MVKNRPAQEDQNKKQVVGERSLMATESYYNEYVKSSSPWVSAEVQERAVARQASLAVASPSAATIQPVTAAILVLAVDFGGSDTFQYMANTDGGCQSKTVTTTGPLRGMIPHPGPRDNNSVWYDPALTDNAKFYEKLIFGYEGVGRVRLDMTDPTDGKPGINLAGYTLQDYYDHMAGVGNVAFSGSIEGWVSVPHSEGYYGASDCAGHRVDGGGPVPASQLVVDAVNEFIGEHPEYYTDTSPAAFWPRFDANRDGVVDTLWIIHAGMGEEAAGGAQGEFAIWSHSSDLRNYGRWPQGHKVYEGDPGTTLDDIVIGSYSILPEDATLGEMVEELGHTLFGLPDLYTNDAENSIGFWSIMSNGTWAGRLGGATPVGMPLWMRMVARCGDDFCNWHEPMFTRAYNGTPENVLIGQLEHTPAGAYKGIRIDLPDTAPAGEGYSSYYLVEWRSNTKYDKMLKTAYVTSFAYTNPETKTDEWFVDRVPYNIPGAVVYYCNNRYGLSKSLRASILDPPSAGPKQRLLVVDMNFEPLRLGDTGEVLSSRAGSYDAALTLQSSKPFTVGSMDPEGNPAPGWSFSAKPAIAGFNDAKGYYAGFYAGPPCPDGEFCYANQDGSTVIPARGNYSTRITHYDGTPYPELYGTLFRGFLLGTGNPGDERLQHGVTISLVRKARHNEKAVLRLKGPVSPDLAITSVKGPSQGKAGDYILMTYSIANYGFEAAKDVTVGFYLSRNKFIDPAEDRRMAISRLPTVPARSVQAKQAVVKIPSWLFPRRYYLGVVADTGNAIFEVNKNNNSRSSKTRIEILPSESTLAAKWMTWRRSLTDSWLSFLLPRV
jgi:M6 family metalloprotease-like protein